MFPSPASTAIINILSPSKEEGAREEKQSLKDKDYFPGKKGCLNVLKFQVARQQREKCNSQERSKPTSHYLILMQTERLSIPGLTWSEQHDDCYMQDVR